MTTVSAGTRLGPYQITRQIGAGGMGEVYAATDTRLGRTVAIKVLPGELSADPDRRERFEREARAVSSVNHPHICTLHDVGEQHGTHYLVMELLEGQTLEHRLQKGRLPLDQALRYAVQIVDALEKAHRAGVVHRDLKPANIMLTQSGVKLLDFGLVKLTRDETASPTGLAVPAPGADALTVAGTILGTPQYMAPEQLEGEPADARTDLFAFGVVLHEMVTGRPAFEGRTQASLIGAILHGNPPSLSSSGIDAPPGLDRLVRTCLEKDRSERWQSARDLKRRLLEIVDETDRSPTGAATPGARPVAAVVAGAWFWRNSPPAGEAIDSVTVLPFVNDTGDSGNDYLSAGIAESIRNNLSQIATLRVATVPTALLAPYAERRVDPVDIARDVGVRAVVSGRVTQIGERFVIQAELIDASDQRLLWGELFPSEDSDIWAVQQGISVSIADELRLKLSDEDEQLVAGGPGGRGEAGILYLRGLQDWNTRSKEGLERATEFFEQAVAVDSDFHEAYAGLARTYIVRAFYGYMPSQTAYDAAIEAAERAIDIEPRSADAHIALGWASVRYLWDWSAGESHFRRGLELAPYRGTSYNWAVTLPASVGRFDEVVAGLERSEELEPLSPGLRIGAGYNYMFARRYDEAVSALNSALELNTGLGAAHRYLAGVYRLRGQYDLAVAASREAVRLEDPIGAIDLVASLAAAGRVDEARSQLASAEDHALAFGDYYFFVAVAYRWLGDFDGAFEWLERAFENRDPWLPFINVHPELDALRADPRLADLARRVGIPLDAGAVAALIQ
jgi:serine/threonine protein kinase/tetratricopeptide (TPR) repeat protein